MRVEFANDHLRRILASDAHKLGLPIAVIKAARKKLLLMENAKDERDLRNWASLNYKKLKGDQMERRTVRINDQYRIVFVLLEDEHPPAIRVLEIGDIH
jgi:proteic killer suppression protein